jgi:hypothetical protein
MMLPSLRSDVQRLAAERPGIPVASESGERLRVYMRENRKEKYGLHRYASVDFEQTDAAIAGNFVTFSERFGFTDERPG